MVLLFLHQYSIWHYTVALSGFVRIVRNFSWFIIHFFSVPTLLRTFLAPYKRITEVRHRRFDIEDLIGTFLINMLSRLVGLLVRSVLLCLALIILLLHTSIALIGFALWLALPFIIITNFSWGIWLIITSI